MAYRTEIEKLEQRYAENPKQWFAALADAYRKQGDVDLAIEYVRGGIDERPDYASAHIVLGRCYLDKNMDDDAARAFEQVLALDAENIVALKSLEEIAERKGDVASARQWLGRLLEVDPMNEEARESLARLGATASVEEPAPAPAGEGAAAEVEGVADSAEAVAEQVEGVVDAYAAQMEPVMPDAAMPPIDTESSVAADAPTAEIEPFEIEKEDADAISLFPAASGASDFTHRAEDTSAEIEPFEIEKDDEDAISPFLVTPAESDSTHETQDTTVEIEPVELEPPFADASSLLAGYAEDAGPADMTDVVEDAESVDMVDDTGARLEPIEIETADMAVDASFLGVELARGSESVFEFEEAFADIEPAKLEPADSDAEPMGDLEFEAPYAGVEPAGDLEFEVPHAGAEPAGDLEFEVPYAGAEPAGDLEFETPHAGAKPAEDLELEPIDAGAEPAGYPGLPEEFEDPDTTPIEAVTPQRPSVPPTKEISAIDLEAMRVADAMVARPAPEPAVVDDDEVLPGALDELEDIAEPEETPLPIDETSAVDASPTTEIEPEELEKLRVEDALVAGLTEQALIPNGIDEYTDDLLPDFLAEEVPEAETESQWGEDPVVALEKEPDAEAEAEAEFLSEMVESAGAFELADEQASERREPEEAEAEVETEREPELELELGIESEFEPEAELSAEAEPAAELLAEAETVPQRDDFDEISEDADWAASESPDLPLIMPDDVGGGAVTPAAEPEPVVTETMAEVYAQQGLLDQAREIYEILVMQHAGDSKLKARLDELNDRVKGAIRETRQSRFSIAATGGVSAVTYLQRIFAHSPGFGAGAAGAADVATVTPEEQAASDPEPAFAPDDRPLADYEPSVPPDEQAASDYEPALTPLEEAFAADQPELPGEPTVAADDEVSLASVFDGGAVEPPSPSRSRDDLTRSADEPGGEAGLSFDEFYGSEIDEASPGSEGSSGEDEPGDVEDEFKRWLKGLKS